MAKKNKLTLVLDELDAKKGTLGKEEVVQIRDAKFGKTSKLPSILARTMAAEMFKDPAIGQFVNALKYEEKVVAWKDLPDDVKSAFLSQMKKDFMRVAKGTNHTDLRIRVVDQGHRASFFYDKKKSKAEKVAEKEGGKKTAAGGKK
jgi:hypothetical protein